jgi:hypothetical protein
MIFIFFSGMSLGDGLYFVLVTFDVWGESSLMAQVYTMVVLFG